LPKCAHCFVEDFYIGSSFQAVALGLYVSNSVLSNEDVQVRTTAFLKECLGDETLHVRGGEAIWQAVKYSITPRIFGGTIPQTQQGHAPQAPSSTPQASQTPSQVTAQPQPAAPAEAIPEAAPVSQPVHNSDAQPSTTEPKKKKKKKAKQAPAEEAPAPSSSVHRDLHQDPVETDKATGA
jgi:hypothetical protein